MNTFKSALGVCGLSQAEAADFFQVRLDTVKSWCKTGGNNPPHGIWKMLASLFDQIQDAADGAAETMDLDGIDPRAYSNIEADLTSDALPTSGALGAAGAMALLMAIHMDED